ncbi:MAG: twin-arginine translocase subunit TatC [Gammaproteobacteria bacterium]|nr:twin-arginine translocase subunit TatC [Gammaproteobacteria bacterium]
MTDNSISPENNQEPEKGFMSHLLELRDRIMRMTLVVLVFFVALFGFSEQIFTFVAQPLISLMPEGTSMIATGVAAPFLVPFKLVLMVSVFLSVPYLLYEIWAFVAPGLYKNEKMMAAPLLISSIILFYCGVAFAYYVLFPLLFGFLIAISPEGVVMMTDIGQYLDFILAIFFAFGIAFEVPIAVFLLIMIGATTPDALAEKRPYVVVGAFVIGMLLTPPDIISQTILAVPMLLLFEIGLIVSRIVLKRRAEQQDEDDKEDEYSEMTEDEMDSELDRIEAEEESESLSEQKPDDK